MSILVVWGAAALACGSVLAKDLGPMVDVAEPQYDFGTILEGRDVVHEFAVHNTGSAVLKIHRIKTG